MSPVAAPKQTPSAPPKTAATTPVKGAVARPKQPLLQEGLRVALMDPVAGPKLQKAMAKGTKFVEGPLPPGVQGHYDLKSDTVTIDRSQLKSLGAMTRTIIHEGMHAVQNHEGKYPGVQTFASKDEYVDNQLGLEADAHCTAVEAGERLGLWTGNPMESVYENWQRLNGNGCFALKDAFSRIPAIRGHAEEQWDETHR
jgi:hypothetical protein